jgi:hypothetical protein
MTSPLGDSRILFLAGLTALLLVVALTRWPLVREGLWRDEALSAFIARSPSLQSFFDRNRVSDHNPPLFNGLVAAWGSVAGFGERSLKVFALFWGLAAIAAVAFLSRQLFGSIAGLLSAVLASSNPVLFGLSAELRSYSLSVFLAALCLMLVVRLRTISPERFADPRWFALTLCLALLAYSHMAGLLVAIVIGVVGLGMSIPVQSRRFGIRLSTSTALAGVAFGPWVSVSLHQARVGLPWQVSRNLAGRWKLLMDRWNDVVSCGGALLLLVVGVGLAYAMTFRDAEDGARLRTAVFGSVLVAVSGLAVTVTFGLYSPYTRYLAIPAALFTVLTGGFLSVAGESRRSGGLVPRILGIGVVVLFLAASLLAVVPLHRDMLERDRRDLPKSGVRTICRQGGIPSGDLVLTAPDYLAPTVWYYCPPGVDLYGFVRWNNPYLFDPRDYRRLWSDPSAVPTTLKRVSVMDTETAGGVFLIWDSQGDGAPLFYLQRVNSLRRALSEKYVPVESALYGGRLEQVGLTRYERNASGPDQPSGRRNAR